MVSSPISHQKGLKECHNEWQIQDQSKCSSKQQLLSCSCFPFKKKWWTQPGSNSWCDDLCSTILAKLSIFLGPMRGGCTRERSPPYFLYLDHVFGCKLFGFSKGPPQFEEGWFTPPPFFLLPQIAFQRPNQPPRTPHRPTITQILSLGENKNLGPLNSTENHSTK